MLYQVKENSFRITYIFFSKEKIGSVVFTKGNGCLSIQYNIEPKYRRQGFGYKIVNQGLDLIKRSQKKEYISATVISSNKASIQILRKLGFEEKENCEDYLFFVLGL